MNSGFFSDDFMLPGLEPRFRYFAQRMPSQYPDTGPPGRQTAEINQLTDILCALLHQFGVPFRVLCITGDERNGKDENTDTG